MIFSMIFLGIFIYLFCEEVDSHFDNFGGSLNQAGLTRAIDLLHSGRCQHVYLDIGTNVGVQLRKLFQPEFFSESPIIDVFSTFFGDVADRRNVCAFGFEPNPALTDGLIKLETAYNLAGFPVVVFTETAAGIENGNMSFYRDVAAAEKFHEWGSSLLKWKGVMGNESSVGTLDLAMFINSAVSRRRGRSVDSKVMAKLDVEGYEFKLLPQLLTSGALCKLNYMYVEFHDRIIDKQQKLQNKQESHESQETGHHNIHRRRLEGNTKMKHRKSRQLLKMIRFLIKESVGCKDFAVEELDDESYGKVPEELLPAFPSPMLQ